LTTPPLTSRGSPTPIIVKAIVEKSPNSLRVLTLSFMSPISGIDQVLFSVSMPGALCRI
jgi:hypothetical protein